ncbi:hypothetical protein NTG1052_140109 [Candidatus Nitrotoga sp. 1052]|nr:hypothetical protein NTG1052_140109 [Candidatus Nitrotoga sp. 1052]
MQRQKDYALDDFCKITNYEKLKSDLDLIAFWAPELVIVDEAQRVKNWNRRWCSVSGRGRMILSSAGWRRAACRPKNVRR